MDKTKAKENINELIEKYKSVIKSSLIKKYSEEDTKKDFILPLFASLGWDTSNRNEVTAEESQSSGRVDYGFYITGRAKFFLETKSLKSDLNKEDYAHQAIRYSWNKGVTWAVLTDFEAIKVFNADTASKYLGDKLFFEIPYTQYLERFDQLWFLSKESFLKDEIDKEAERIGKKLQKVSVTNLLYKDLNECRKILTNSLSICNDRIPKDLIDEGVQKILDRLIFLRVAEDRKIEPPILKPLIRESLTSAAKKKIPLYSAMVKKFRELDKIYNSNLFSPHAFESWEEYGGATEKVVDILYGKKGYFEYDFKVIPADILGTVYENYLGYVAKARTAKKGNQLAFSGFSDALELEKEKGKRKEQGIYYTPSFIVDFIVRNALKPVLDNCKSINDLKKIKVLDPACGSGSFLIKALEIFVKKYGEFNYKESEYLKIQIITENLYGVDLDEQAVEITGLNLLLNALEQREKLPPLDNNIKNGNSLISGTDEDLKKIFGKNFRSKKPFNWTEEFPEVFKKGGFDVIIGNPPWVFTRGENFSDSEKLYFNNYLIKSRVIPIEKGKNIQSGKLNLYSLFSLRAIELLKPNGILGFIIPNNILRTTTFDIIRKYILDFSRIKLIADLGANIFQGVTAASIIIILTKEASQTLRNNNSIDIISGVEDLQGSKFKKHKIKQQVFYKNKSFAFNVLSDNKTEALSRKIEQNCDCLGIITKYIIEGIVGSLKKDVSDKRINEQFKPFLIGKDIGRYQIKYKNRWICYDRKKLHRARPEEVFLSQKIILQRISGGDNPLVAALDDFKYYTFASINNIVLNAGSFYDIKYVLGLINSKLINWYYSINFSNRSVLTVNVSKTFLSQIPIRKVTKREQRILVDFVEKIITLNQKLRVILRDSDEWNVIKSEIEKTSKKIDEEVYKLYGLTPEEIEIVER